MRKIRKENSGYDNQHLYITLDSIGDGVITTDVDGNIIFINKKAQELTGWNKNEGVGKSIEEIFMLMDWKSGEKLENPFKRTMKNQSAVGLKNYTVLLSKDGTQKFISANSAPIKNNKKITGAVIVFRDITKIKLMEEEILNKQQTLQSIFDAAPIGIIIVDEDMIITKINDTALKMIGKNYTDTIHEIVGNGFGCISSQENEDGCGYGYACKSCKLKMLFTKVFHSGISYRGLEMQFTLCSKEKESNPWLRINYEPIVIDGCRHIMMVIDDITENKMVEEEIRKAKEVAEKTSKAKSEFLANMSHEIRTPLNGVLGMIDLTLLTNLTSKQKENLYIAKKCAHSLLAVINDILDFSKIEAGKMDMKKLDLEIRPFIKETLHIHKVNANNKGLDFKYRISKEIPEILIGDSNRLEQILNNIVGNAIKFTEVGSVVAEIDKYMKTDSKIYLKFAISDTGIGIGKNEIPLLFQSFSQIDGSTTRKHGGTGLGLVISKRLIEMMGGKIWLESEKDQGSTFHFILAFGVADQKGLRRKENKSEEYPKRKEIEKISILLVEDNKINQLVTKQMLEERGYEVYIASNGKKALEILDKKNFDVILMDIQMPEMDGIEATRRIREVEKEKNIHYNIVALTGYAVEGDKERFLSSGMDAYLSKPIQMKELFESIDNMVKNKKNPLQSIKKEIQSLEREERDKGSKKIEEKKRIFISNLKEEIKKINLALDLNEMMKAERIAHTMKEEATVCEEYGMKNMAFKMELALRRESKEEAYQWCEKIEEKLKEM